MKKKLLIIGIVIGILLIGFVFLFLFPVYNHNLMNNKLDNPEFKDDMKEETAKSYDEVIAKYQQALDYPYNMFSILNLGINDMESCMSEYNQDGGFCTVQYAYHDLNGDGIDELIIGNNMYDNILITDIYYYDGSSAKSLLGGFWYRNSVTIYENGKFIVHGSGGACCGNDSYYGNTKSIENNVDNWNDFGLVLNYEYDVDQGEHSYMKFDKEHNQTNISEKEFNKLTESFNNKVDYKKWDWTKLTSNQDVKVDDKYKVKDYIYLTDKDKIVQGIVKVQGFQTNYTAYELAVSYPKLYETIIRFATDVTGCYNQGKKCTINLSSYEFPMKYMQETGDLRNPIEWHFVISSTIEVYYDSNNDGYVDTSSKNGYLVAPIDEYNERFGELID